MEYGHAMHDIKIINVTSYETTCLVDLASFVSVLEYTRCVVDLLGATLCVVKINSALS